MAAKSIRIAPKGKFRVIGSNSQSVWVAGTFMTFNTAKIYADIKVAEADGYDSMAIYDNMGKRLYSTGLSMSIDLSVDR